MRHVYTDWLTTNISILEKFMFVCLFITSLGGMSQRLHRSRVVQSHTSLQYRCLLCPQLQLKSIQCISNLRIVHRRGRDDLAWRQTAHGGLWKMRTHSLLAQVVTHAYIFFACATIQSNVANSRRSGGNTCPHVTYRAAAARTPAQIPSPPVPSTAVLLID